MVAVIPAQPCVVVRGALAATATGLPPGAAVRIGFRNDAAQPTGVVGPDGTIALGGIVAPPGLVAPDAHATERFPLGVYAADPSLEAVGAPPLATASVRVGQANAFLLPRTADVSRLRTIDAAGFTPGQRLYVHVRVDSRQRRTLSLGTAGSCGEVRVRRRFLRGLGRLPQFGVAYLQIDASRRASRATRPRAEIQVRLRRRFVGVKPNYSAETALRTFTP